MRVIKKFTKGNYTLIHSQYEDSFGYLRDNFQITEKSGDGEVIKHPVFSPPITLRSYKSRNLTIGKSSKYVKKEYEKIMNRELNRIKNK